MVKKEAYHGIQCPVSEVRDAKMGTNTGRGGIDRLACGMITAAVNGSILLAVQSDIAINKTTDPRVVATDGMVILIDTGITQKGRLKRTESHGTPQRAKEQVSGRVMKKLRSRADITVAFVAFFWCFFLWNLV